MGEFKQFVRGSGVQIVEAPVGIVGLSLRGFVSFPLIAQALTRADAALADDIEARAVVLDVMHIDGFEPGVPARVIQWLRARTPRVTVAVLVTTSPVLVATVRAAEVMLPDTIVSAVSSAGEAYARAQFILGSRRRVSTGVNRPVANIHAITAARKQAG